MVKRKLYIYIYIFIYIFIYLLVYIRTRAPFKLFAFCIFLLAFICVFLRCFDFLFSF